MSKILATDPKRVINLRLVYPEDASRYEWKLYRCPVAGWWELKDHEGYVRILEKTYADSLPRVRAIIANHGFELLHELS